MTMRIDIPACDFNELETGRKIEWLSDHIIGLWRFRSIGESSKWCVTYCFLGAYFDVGPCDTKDEALVGCYEELAAALYAIQDDAQVSAINDFINSLSLPDTTGDDTDSAIPTGDLSSE